MKYILKIFGYFPLMFLGDSAVLDRFFWLRRNLKAGDLRTLDAGSGSGAFTLYAAKIGNNSTGVSFDERNNRVALQRAELLGLSNAKFMHGNLNKLSELNLGKFDQIICFETIEHIMDDDGLLKNLSSVLKPGGCILLTTPYKHYHPLPEDAVSETEDGGHVRWGYTHEEMRRLMGNAGLKIEKEEYLSGFASQCLIRIHRILSKYVPDKLVWLILFPFRIFQILDRPLTNLIHYPYMCIAVVATKNES